MEINWNEKKKQIEVHCQYGILIQVLLNSWQNQKELFERYIEFHKPEQGRLADRARIDVNENEG